MSSQEKESSCIKEAAAKGKKERLTVDRRQFIVTVASFKMSSKKHSFRYRQLDIYKNQTLGKGSYGVVYKAKCDQLTCAAKILHDELIDKLNEGADKIIKKFELECEFLSGIRHPNIVQYLGTARCPNRSKMPILMMELLEENLTKMLENAKHPLPFYLEVDLCHDIALAVAYLHSNDIVHRDLSSNNVLITAGRQAKLTDFGLSRLIKGNSSPLILSHCPGTQAYMPPEALTEPPDYNEKLDCYSEGVLMIQICCRLTPTPGERSNHMQKIRPSHPLLPIANKCLSKSQYERDSAEELCQRLEILQEGVEYKQSLLPTAVDSKDVDELERQNKLIQKCLDQYTQQIKDNDKVIGEIKQSNEFLQQEITQMQKGGIDTKSGEMKSKQRWLPGRNLPVEMVRGDVAVDGDVAYFMNKDGALYKYDSTVDPHEAWNKLVKCPHTESSLAVIDGLLTAIGGLEFKGLGNKLTNVLISLKGDEIKTWEKHFPPMLKARYQAAVATTSKHVIVIGGLARKGVAQKLEALDKVEIMNTAATPLTWSNVARLIQPYHKMSAAICGSQLYVLGGDYRGASKLVMACSVNSLLQSNQDTLAGQIWRQPTAVPNYFATCTSVNGELLAVGGTSDAKSSKTQVYRYNQTEGSWNLFTNMITPRYNSLVAVFPTKNLMVVVGGHDQNVPCDVTELCYL